MVTATRRPQQSFTETQVNDPELEAMLGDYFDSREAAHEPAKRFRAAKKTLKEAVTEKGLLDRVLNEEVRVGPYILSGRSLEGGPTEIPEWRSWTAKVERAPA